MLGTAAGGALAAAAAALPGAPAAGAAGAQRARPAVDAGGTVGATTVQGEAAEQIVALTRVAMTEYALRAAIVRVTVDGREVVTAALGESLTGEPATPQMHFRNGAVAIAYMATLLLQLVDAGTVRLDDPLARWLPELPDAGRVTLRMLANMTSGYPDYVPDAGLTAALYADPFRQWAPQELIAIGLAQPRVFAPGTNWDYSHTNYVILGQVLERIAGQPLADLMRERILGPLNLRNTDGPPTAAIRAPALHAFSSERRAALGIPAGTRFYEESTYWNPSWTLAQGAIQTTNIYDLATTAVAVGTGALLSPASHRAQIAPDLRGFGAPLAGCRTCHTLDLRYTYGLGVVLQGPWILQNPLFGGYGAVAAYLPAQRLAVAVATTYGEASFDPSSGDYKHGNVGQAIFAAIGAYLAPDAAPPAPGR
jgi:CubicO group peptidase (beta-lactamase class C family)